MAGIQLCATRLLFLFLIRWSLVLSGPVSIAVQNVPNPLVVDAFAAINNDSPTHHRYKGGNLISAQKLVEPPYVTYRLTFDLTPVCKETLESCPREACTIQVKQHQEGGIDVLRDSIQCMYLYPQSIQDDAPQVEDNIQEQDTVDNLDKQIISNQSVELDHEIQATGDQNDKPFIAMRASSSKYCPGCPYELNPSLPGLTAFGEQAVQSMDEVIQNDFKHKLIGIVKVTRAVPVSSNVIQYQMLLQIGESDCLKNAIVDQSECAVRPDIPIKVCLVTFEEQPWQRSSRKITKNNCTLAAEAENVQEKVSYSGFVSETPVPSSQTKDQATSEKMSALEGLRDIIENFTYATPIEEEKEDELQPMVTEHPILKVLINGSDDDEPLAGFVDKVKEFGEFLEDFSLPTREENKKPDSKLEEVKEDVILPKKVLTNAMPDDLTSRQKRETRVGAPSSRDVNDPEIQEFARKGLHKFSENSEGPNEPIIVEVTEASAQVVSGMLYKIKVKLGTSDCPKGVKENCQLKSESEIKECLFSIWSQPWKDKGSPEITINCDLNQRKKRSLRGVNYSHKMLKQAEDMKAEPLFEDFMKTFGKTYASPEERKTRYEIFKDNLRTINDLQKFEQGTAQYGITMFADLTYEEFKDRYLGLRPELQSENNIPFPQAEIPDTQLPPKFDWREYNAVTPVKDQGQCGSCWAFSVTGNVEGQYAIKHGKLISLSEQELVDCDTLDEGCDGGLPDNAYRAVENLGGLELESDYPYDAKDEKCHFNKSKAKARIVSAVNITSNETDMAKWLIKNGPISIGINANAMQFYIGGVSHPFKFLCNPKNLDHGVLIVGYGISKYPLFHKELPYWIIKNSWGPRWGEQGYYRVYRGDGTCGVNTMATSAVVA